jgi:hypothetical protein
MEKDRTRDKITRRKFGKVFTLSSVVALLSGCKAKTTPDTCAQPTLEQENSPLAPEYQGFSPDMIKYVTIALNGLPDSSASIEEAPVISVATPTIQGVEFDYRSNIAFLNCLAMVDEQERVLSVTLQRLDAEEHKTTLSFAFNHDGQPVEAGRRVTTSYAGNYWYLTIDNVAYRANNFNEIKLWEVSEDPFRTRTSDQLSGAEQVSLSTLWMGVQAFKEYFIHIQEKNQQLLQSIFSR